MFPAMGTSGSADLKNLNSAGLFLKGTTLSMFGSMERVHGGDGVVWNQGDFKVSRTP
jgi:hypothetical protein